MDFKWFGFHLVCLYVPDRPFKYWTSTLENKMAFICLVFKCPGCPVSSLYYVKVVNGKVLFMSVKLYNEDLSIQLVWYSIGQQLPGFQIWMTSDYWNMTLVNEWSYQSFDSCPVVKYEWQLITGMSHVMNGLANHFDSCHNAGLVKVQYSGDPNNRHSNNWIIKNYGLNDNWQPTPLFGLVFRSWLE